VNGQHIGGDPNIIAPRDSECDAALAANGDCGLGSPSQHFEPDFTLGPGVVMKPMHAFVHGARIRGESRTKLPPLR
jgi:hypothetical protein